MLDLFPKKASSMETHPVDDAPEVGSSNPEPAVLTTTGSERTETTADRVELREHPFHSKESRLF